MKNNFFPTLGEALDAVREFLVAGRCELADADDLFNHFTYGGVNYGETRRASSLLSVYKGKPIAGRMAKRAATVSIFRMESGTYECVAYVC